MDANLELFVDSSAAIAMMTREGLGRARHISTQVLWVQEAIQKKVFAIKKVRTDMNPADIFTKQLMERKVVDHVTRMHCEAPYIA